MKRIAFIITVLLFALSSCNNSNNYIIPVDYERYYKGVTSLTEKESQELQAKIMMDWYNNTIGKEIPDIHVKDLDGNTIKLKKWLKKETILIFTSPHCGFGKEEVEKGVSFALQNIKEELEGIDILCLIELTKESDQQITLDYAKSLQGTYDNLFIINLEDALKANLTACPTKFFIDKKQIVRHVQLGMTTDKDRSENEIRQGISFTR